MQPGQHGRLRWTLRRIEEALTCRRDAMAAWQDLVDQCGFTARYGSATKLPDYLAASQQVKPKVPGGDP